jgi:methylenetetrahydrofolate dehydrogenase (NADP+)/methenyltetrahydrofolate cyclohydrolase
MISCKEYAENRKQELKEKISKIKYRKPCLAIIQVGDNCDSNSYVKWKIKDAEEIGIKAELYKISSNVSHQRLKSLVKELNKSCDIDGIIIQLPLPDHIDIEDLQMNISPNKDVDGFRSDSELVPCTPGGVINFLKANNVKLDGTNVTIVGRGKCAGRPMIDMFIDENATVTACNSHTSKEILKMKCLSSDIIISCTGVENIITKDMILNNTICIDVGRGDFAIDADDATIGLQNVWLSPKISGTGLLTRIQLMENVYEAFCNHSNEDWEDESF